MVLTKQASEHKPKRPLTGFFRFRLQKLNELGDDQNKNQKTRQLWDMLDQKEKLHIHEEYEHQLQRYKKQLEEWKEKYHVLDSDMRRKSTRKRSYDTDEQEERHRPVKTKGRSSRKLSNKKKMEKARRAKAQKSQQKRRANRGKNQQTSDEEEEESYSSSEYSESSESPQRRGRPRSKSLQKRQRYQSPQRQSGRGSSSKKGRHGSRGIRV